MIIITIIPTFTTSQAKEIPSSKSESPPIETSSSQKSVNAYATQSPLKIFNNSAFGAGGYGFAGEGNETHPYIIEGYNITSSTETLIHVENTTAHFVIQDCLLNETSNSYLGIFLNNVTNGTISNNIIRNTLQGIKLEWSSYNVIEHNYISESLDSGIEIYNESHYNSILHNTLVNLSNDYAIDIHGVHVGGIEWNMLETAPFQVEIFFFCILSQIFQKWLINNLSLFQI